MRPLLALWRVRALTRLGRTREARAELRLVLRCPVEPTCAADTFDQTRVSLGLTALTS